MNIKRMKVLALLGVPLFAIAVAVMVFSIGSNADPVEANHDLAMSLSVPAGQTVACPPSKEPKTPGTPLVCVPFDGKIDLTVNADVIPDAGYQLVDAWINYGDELGDQAANGAIKQVPPSIPWVDIELATFQFGNTDEAGDSRLDSVLLGGLTGQNTLFSPLFGSFQTGPVYSISLTCTSGPSNTAVFLVLEGDHPAGTDGALYTEFGTNRSFRPAVTDIEVSCVEAPEPVGGIALDPELRAPPLETPQPAGLSVGMLAGVAAALGVGSLTLAGATWYARRPR